MFIYAFPAVFVLHLKIHFLLIATSSLSFLLSTPVSSNTWSMIPWCRAQSWFWCVFSGPPQTLQLLFCLHPSLSLSSFSQRNRATSRIICKLFLRFRGTNLGLTRPYLKSAKTKPCNWWNTSMCLSVNMKLTSCPCSMQCFVHSRLRPPL